MATLPDTYPNLLNVTRRMRPDGGIETQFAELLMKYLPELEDIPWVEGNLPTGHKVMSRTALPVPKWRRFNQGLDPSKSEVAAYTETCGMLEDYSKVDVALAELGGNAAAYRAGEDAAFVEGFSQEFSRALFYESGITNAERIHGLTPRYPATTGYTSSPYVKKLGTVSGINAQSIWLVSWGQGGIYGIYPKGSVGGLQREDLGKQLVPDMDGRQFLAYVTHFKWLCGLSVQDYRRAVRMQWDPDDAANADSGKTLYLALMDLMGTIRGGDNRVIYMSQLSANKVNAQLLSNSLDPLKYIERNGKLVPTFMGATIRITDTLIPESAIS